MTEAMQAIVFHGPGHWALEEFPRPRIQAADDVLLHVDRVSICGTDIHILSDPPGHPATPGSILGHEYVATVTDIGEGVINVQPGDRVVIDPNITCGLCDYCRIRAYECLREYDHAWNLSARGAGRVQSGARESAAQNQSRMFRPNAPVWPSLSLACCMLLKRPMSYPVKASQSSGPGPIGLLFLMLFKSCGRRKSFRYRADRVSAANGRTSWARTGDKPEDRRCRRRGESYHATLV